MILAPQSREGWLRPVVSVIVGCWMATVLHKPFWIWAPIFGYGVLTAIFVAQIIYITIAFYFQWRKDHRP